MELLRLPRIRPNECVPIACLKDPQGERAVAIGARWFPAVTDEPDVESGVQSISFHLGLPGNPAVFTLAENRTKTSAGVCVGLPVIVVTARSDFGSLFRVAYMPVGSGAAIPTFRTDRAVHPSQSCTGGAYYPYGELPPSIDAAATRSQFIAQMSAGSFANPLLVPYLLKVK